MYYQIYHFLMNTLIKSLVLNIRTHIHTHTNHTRFLSLTLKHAHTHSNVTVKAEYIIPITEYHRVPTKYY